MIRVGNDVVDLDEPAIADSHTRVKFLERVLTRGERARVEAAAEPKRLLWACFAAKEAAYKALAKDTAGLVLAHRRFEVAEDLGSIAHRGQVLRLKVEALGGAVHAVVWAGPVAPLAAVTTLEPGSNPSAEVRARLLEGLGDAYRGVRLTVAREPRPGSWDGFGPPRVVRDDGVPLPLEVSLSHDGRYVAWARVGLTG